MLSRDPEAFTVEKKKKEKQWPSCVLKYAKQIPFANSLKCKQKFILDVSGLRGKSFYGNNFPKMSALCLKQFRLCNKNPTDGGACTTAKYSHCSGAERARPGCPHFGFH